MNSKLIFSVLMCLLSLTLLFSCHKTPPAAPPSLYVGPKMILLDSATGSTSPLSITANVPWKITMSPASASSWLQLSQTEGQTNATVTLTVTAKNTNTAQPVTLTVEATGNVNLPAQTATVSQQGALTVDNTLLFNQGVARIDSIKVLTNLSWKATASDAWIHLDTAQGAGSYLLRASIDTNLTGITRNGTITLTPTDNANVQPVQVAVQQAYYFGMTGFSPQSGPTGTTVTINGYFTPDVQVMIGGVTTPIVSHTTKQLVVTIPSNAVGNPLYVYSANSSYASATSQKPFVLTKGWNNRAGSGLNNVGTGSIVFNYGGTLYTGFGTNSPATLYRLDTATYTWSAAATIPTNAWAYYAPFSFMMNNKLYVGGIGETTPRFWEYDPAQGNSPSAWRSLTTMPDNLSEGYAFSIGNTGYIQSGTNTVSGINSLYTFTTSGPSDPGTWTLLGQLGVQNGLASGFVLGNTAYFGGGALYDPTQAVRFNSLTPPSTTLTPMPVLADTVNKSSYNRAPTFTIGNTGYLYISTSFLPWTTKAGSGNIYSYTAGAGAWNIYCTAPPGNGYMGYDAAGAIGNRIFIWNGIGQILEYIP